MNNNNPYKGVTGGDPFFRKAHVMEEAVAISFWCPNCGNRVTQIKTRNDPGVCRGCRIIMNLANQQKIEKERQEEANAKRLEAIRAEKAIPLRSDEERLALIEKALHEGHSMHDCSDCHKMFLIHSDGFVFAGDSMDSINHINTVRYQIDPFAAEINNDMTKRWLCQYCYNISADEI